MATVTAALMELRSPIAMVEMDLHACVGQRLAAAGLPFVHEAYSLPGQKFRLRVPQTPWR